jgi:quinohemoprotein ethanol dehydrogenase
VIVTLTPQDMPGALQFSDNPLDLRPDSGGVFTSVRGPVIAMFDLLAGYTLDGDVKLVTPLTSQTFPADKAEMIANGKKLKITFDKGSVDNNIPAGDAVPLTVTASFIHGGVQTKLSSTAAVQALK